MMILGLIGLLMLFSPVMIFMIERGGFDLLHKGDDGDLVLWLMTKTPEQILLISGSIVAGISLVTVALAQRAWMM